MVEEVIEKALEEEKVVKKKVDVSREYVYKQLKFNAQINDRLNEIVKMLNNNTKIIDKLLEINDKDNEIFKNHKENFEVIAELMVDNDREVAATRNSLIKTQLMGIAVVIGLGILNKIKKKPAN